MIEILRKKWWNHTLKKSLLSAWISLLIYIHKYYLKCIIFMIIRCTFHACMAHPITYLYSGKSVSNLTAVSFTIFRASFIATALIFEYKKKLWTYEDVLNVKKDSKYRKNGFHCRWTSRESFNNIYTHWITWEHTSNSYLCLWQR